MNIWASRNAVLGYVALSVGVHLVGLTIVRRFREPVPERVATRRLPPLEVELPVETIEEEEPPPLGSPDGTEPSRSGTSKPAVPARDATVSRDVQTRPAADEPVPGGSLPPSPPPSASAEVSEAERLRVLRESVERAMLSTDRADAGGDARGSPDGVAGGKGPIKAGGYAYLSGWFSSLISVRQLRLTSEDKTKATALAAVTIADGTIQSASLSQPGEVAAYNQAVAASLARLVGRTVPQNSLGETPSGSFSLRLRPR